MSVDIDTENRVTMLYVEFRTYIDRQLRKAGYSDDISYCMERGKDGISFSVSIIDDMPIKSSQIRKKYDLPNKFKGIYPIEYNRNIE